MNIRHIFIVILVFLSGCRTSQKKGTNNLQISAPVMHLDFQLIKTYPHDTESFTEGLVFYNSKLFESTGAPEEFPQTKSLFGEVDLISGGILTKGELDREKYFGEGITFLHGKIFQLTYKTRIGFVYDAGTFKKTGEFILPTKEGWGLTTDGTSLIMSDGTYQLTYIDPNTFEVTKTLNVTENDYALVNLNELEYIKGFIYANVFTTNLIVKINPESGRVVGKLDLTPFSEEVKGIYPEALEMNGVAYDSLSNHVFITGKFWPKIYELKISEL